MHNSLTELFFFHSSHLITEKKIKKLKGFLIFQAAVD